MSFGPTEQEERKAWDRYFAMAVRTLVERGIAMADAVEMGRRTAEDMLTIRRDVLGVPPPADDLFGEEEEQAEPRPCPHSLKDPGGPHMLKLSADGRCTICWKVIV